MGRKTWRGHPIELEGDAWIYIDTKARVDGDPNRACGYCGLSNSSEGHDGCLKTLPCVMNACCGHGDPQDAYVQFLDGSSVHGTDAVEAIGCLKVN